MYPTNPNIVLPAGYCFFDEEQADGSFLGELYFAETPGFSLNIATESTNVKTDDGPIAEDLIDKVTSVTRSFDLKVKGISGDVWAAFIMATLGSKSTTAGAVTGDEINEGVALLGGRWYQLGVSASYPSGLRGLESVAIKTGATAHVLDTDYKLDAETGRIYVIPDGGCDGAICTADFSKTAVSWEHIASHDLGPKKGRFRYLAANADGLNRDLFCKSVVLAPNGALELKGRTNPQIAGFTVKVQKPADGTAPVILNGRPL